MPDKLTGTRIDDPPPEHQRFRFRLELAVRKYPVQIAVAVLLAVACIPLFMLLNSNADLRHSNSQLRTALVATQSNRKATLKTICVVINHNATQSNTQTDYLKSILINSTKASRPFESTFRKLGLPPYRTRMKNARKQADGLTHLKLPPLDCGRLEADAERQIKALKSGVK